MKAEGIEKEEGIRQKKGVALRKDRRKQQQNESKHIIFSTFFAMLDTGKQNKAVVEQRQPQLTQSNSRLFATQQTTAHVRALLSFLHSSRLAFYPVFLWLWYNAFSGSIANKIQWWFWCVQYRLSFPGDLAQILYHNLQLQDLKSCIKRSDTVCPQVLTEACSWQTEWRICMLVFKKNVVAGGWNKIKQVWQVSVWEWQLLSSVGINLVSVGFCFAF